MRSDVGPRGRPRRGALPPRSLTSQQRLEKAVSAGLLASLLAAAGVLPASRPLPVDLCLLHRLTGFACVACGLTRSVCRLLQGDPAASLRLHPAGPIVAALVLLLAVQAGIEALLAREWSRPCLDRLVRVGVSAALAIALASWLARAAGAWGG